MKKVKVWLLLGAFGFLLALCVAEISLRILGFSANTSRIDPATGLVTLVPDAYFFLRDTNFKNLVETNKAGFHDEEFSLEKPAGTFRIVIVGDSYIEALQVAKQEMLSQILQKQLNQYFPGKHFEVIAIGKSGNGTFQNYQYLLNYGLKYKPDLVIDAFLVGNDFRDDSVELAKMFEQESGQDVISKHVYARFDSQRILMNASEMLPVRTGLSAFLRNLFSRSSLLVTLYKAEQKIQAKKYYSDLPSEKILLDYQVCLVHYPKVWLNAWHLEEKLIQTMKKTVEANGAKFLLVSLTEDSRVRLQPAAVLDYNKPERLLADMSVRVGFPYLPLLPAFRLRYSKTGNHPHNNFDGHWNQTGHQWAAETIFDYLKLHPALLQKTN